MKSKAFTIVELLVVIAIIALLISLLMPALSKAKQVAELTVAQANFRNHAIGYNAYAITHDGLFPNLREGAGPDRPAHHVDSRHKAYPFNPKNKRERDSWYIPGNNAWWNNREWLSNNDESSVLGILALPSLSEFENPLLHSHVTFENELQDAKDKFPDRITEENGRRPLLVQFNKDFGNGNFNDKGSWHASGLLDPAADPPKLRSVQAAVDTSVRIHGPSEVRRQMVHETKPHKEGGSKSGYYWSEQP